MKILQSEKGNTLVITILVLLMASVIGLTLMSMSLNGTKRNEHRENYSQAVEQAENGIKHITLQIQKDLEEKIKDLEQKELEAAEKLFFMSENKYKESFNQKFDEILDNYSCDSGLGIIETKNNLKYSVCYNKENSKSITDTLRSVQFESIGYVNPDTSNELKETLISNVQLGARYSDYPKELNYAVATNDGGNLMINGGITIDGDVHADGNIITSESAYLPKIVNNKRWIDSVAPSIEGNTTFPSTSKKARLLINRTDGHLISVNEDALNNGCKKNLIQIGSLLNIDYTDYINYDDLYKYDFANNIEDNCLFKVKPVQEVDQHLFDSSTVEIFDTVPFEKMDVGKIVEIGRKSIANTVKINRPNNEYERYTINILGIPTKSSLYKSYTAQNPTLLELGIIASLEEKPVVTGDFKVANIGLNVALTKYTFDGNFFFDNTVANLTAGSGVTLKGNYYFKQDSLITEVPIIMTGGGKNTLNGNFYFENKNGLVKEALSILNGSHTLIGNYFINGDVKFWDTTIKANAVLFVNGDVKIDRTTIKNINDGHLIIFATGDIQYNYASDMSIKNALDDYYNEDQREMNVFLYANGKVELHGTVSNYKINGGVVGQNVALTGIRGEVKNSLLGGKTFPPVYQQTDKESRLIINYDENLVTYFNKLVENVGIQFHDLELLPVTTLSRELK